MLILAHELYGLGFKAKTYISQFAPLRVVRDRLTSVLHGPFHRQQRVERLSSRGSRRGEAFHGGSLGEGSSG